MFIIRIFTGSIIGMISGVLLSLFLLVLVFGGVLVVLASTGSPSDCTPGGGPLTIDASNAAAFRGKWDTMAASLDGGAPASANFTESEISSRADEYLKEKDAPIKDPRVCLHDGVGEGTARISVLGFDAKFKLKGTMKLDGAHPDVNVDSIEIGNIPGFLLAPGRAHRQPRARRRARRRGDGPQVHADADRTVRPPSRARRNSMSGRAI